MSITCGIRDISVASTFSFHLLPMQRLRDSLVSYSSKETIWKKVILFLNCYFFFEFQGTVCGNMTECTSPHMTVTTITGQITVQQHIMERGGITHVTGQILTGNMGTLNMAKGSIGIPGKVSITQ